MLTDVQIVVIGAGAMGSAIIGGILRRKLVAPPQIVATDPVAERLQHLHQLHGIATTIDNQEAARQGHLVIFAVKPQMIPEVLPPMTATLRSDAVVLSIAAGMPLATFVDGLQHSAVARAMPNTPAQIGEGMTVWTTTPEVNTQQRALVKTALAAFGRERFVENEGELDMATAISGSGPAYIFLVIEAMIDAGVQMGFSRAVAEELVLQTMVGASCYAQQSGQHPAILRNAVTSSGGTTAAGLNALEQGKLRAVLSDGIWAAYRRSQELGRRTSES